MASWEDLAAPVGQNWENAAPVVGGTIPAPRQAQDLTDAVISGLKASSAGLALRGKLPDQQLDENAPWYMRAAHTAGSVVGDIPAMIAGGAMGATGGPAGVVAGSFAAPMALREALTDAYSHNYASTWDGVWNIAKSALTGATKGAAVGLATFGAGKVVAPLMEPLGLLGKAGTLGTEVGALTTTSAAVEGHLPTAQDFLDNAILLAGVKGAVKVVGGPFDVAKAAAALRETYAQTGLRPDEVIADAKQNPLVAEALARGELPQDYTGLALDERVKAAVSEDPRPEAIRQTFSQVDPPKLGEPPLNDPVKYEYITDQDTLKGVLRNVEGLYQKEISTQTQGAVSNMDTAAKAIKLVTTGEVADHVIGEANNAAELYARAHVLKGVTENAYEKMRALAGVDPADLTPRMKLEALSAIEQVSMTLADFRGARAEAGRALQIFQKIKRDSSILGDADTITKLYEKNGKLSDISKLVAAFKDPAQMQTFADGYVKATTLEKVLEVWKAGLISGPQTHLANIMGNIGKWVTDIPESAISATITSGVRAFKGDPLSWAQFKARALAPLYGIQMGALDAVKIAGEVIRGSGDNLEKGDVYRHAIEGKLGSVIRSPFLALSAEDALFRTVAERAESHIMATDRLAKEDVMPGTAEYRDLLVKYTQDPSLLLGDKEGLAATQRMQQAGAEGVFSQRLGPRMEAVQRALNGSPAQFVMPFFRTPVNLLSWAVQHTPGLNLLSGQWRADFMAGGERTAKATARVVVGTSLALTAYSMTQNGSMTGGGLFDKPEGGTKRAAGWQPYSFLIDGKYYSYQRMEPVSHVLGIASDLVEMMQQSKDPIDKTKMGLMLALVFGNATVSQTYMSGLANTINGVTDPERYLPTLMQQYGSSLVPKIVGQTAAAIDPNKREVDSIMDAVQSQIPYLREKLLPKRDVWGEPTTNDKWFEVMPVAVTQVSEDKVRSEAQRLQLAISDVPKYIMEKGPFKSDEKRTELTPEQRDIMKQVSGKTAMQWLAPIVNAPDWNRIPDYAQAEIYKKIIEGARKLGSLAALPPDEASRVQMRQNVVNKIIQQNLKADTGKPKQQRTVE